MSSNPVSDSDRLRLVDHTDEIDLPQPEGTPAPAPPRRGWFGVLLAGAVGGGALLGGGAAAAATAAVAAIGALVLTGGAILWFVFSTPAIDATDANPVEELAEDDAPLADDAADDAVDETPEADDGVAEAAPTPRARRRAPAPTPATPAPAPAPAPAAVPLPADLRPQQVKILTNPPAATVYIDGLAAGRTPLKTELEPGPHTIRVMSGKADSSFSVSVADSGESRFCYAIKGKKVLASGC